MSTETKRIFQLKYKTFVAVQNNQCRKILELGKYTNIFVSNKKIAK